MGLFRVVFAGLLLADVGSLWVHHEYLYGDAAVVAASEACGGVRGATAMCLVPGSVGASIVLGLFALSTVAFGVGLYTRVTKWLTAYLFASIVVRNGIALAGEQVFGCFLFLLCLSRCGAAYSFDNVLRRRHRPTSATYEKIPAWPRRLMILQLAIADGVAGWAKTGATYSEGTALYYMLASDRWFRFEPWWLLATFGDNVLRVATWGAWCFERLFPLVVVRLAFRDRVRWLRPASGHARLGAADQHAPVLGDVLARRSEATGMARDRCRDRVWREAAGVR